MDALQARDELGLLRIGIVTKLFSSTTHRTW
jgi:hypothetical protein